MRDLKPEELFQVSGGGKKGRGGRGNHGSGHGSSHGSGHGSGHGSNHCGGGGSGGGGGTGGGCPEGAVLVTNPDGTTACIFP